ncbi:hypothetical protein [Corynebacterium aquilae]|uniref:Uncharacterized protein n=1 Tax=Corynebacterium aquilae DSM 44791 TaxID=1431546 RepID=A0A1L7CF31_9CORY|nr:hypothetical protein [Corynebacterium aquilae]APT84445.1 hypothetical protein CAQU_04485 [Corynebacterium aquilae DSM 44791]
MTPHRHRHPHPHTFRRILPTLVLTTIAALSLSSCGHLSVNTPQKSTAVVTVTRGAQPAQPAAPGQSEPGAPQAKITDNADNCGINPTAPEILELANIDPSNTMLPWELVTTDFDACADYSFALIVRGPVDNPGSSSANWLEPRAVFFQGNKRIAEHAFPSGRARVDHVGGPRFDVYEQRDCSNATGAVDTIKHIDVASGTAQEVGETKQPGCTTMSVLGKAVPLGQIPEGLSAHGGQQAAGTNPQNTAITTANGNILFTDPTHFFTCGGTAPGVTPGSFECSRTDGGFWDNAPNQCGIFAGRDESKTNTVIINGENNQACLTVTDSFVWNNSDINPDKKPATPPTGQAQLGNPTATCTTGNAVVDCTWPGGHFTLTPQGLKP